MGTNKQVPQCARGRSCRVLNLHHLPSSSTPAERYLASVTFPNNTTRAIPAWMFDELLCPVIRPAEQPIVDSGALSKFTPSLDSVHRGLRTRGHDTTTTLHPASFSLVPQLAIGTFGSVEDLNRLLKRLRGCSPYYVSRHAMANPQRQASP